MRILKKSLLCFALNVSLVGVLANTLFAWSAGPPAYMTGAPEDNGTCNIGGCHDSYPLNSGSANISIVAPDSYTPGKAVKIKVSFNNSSGKLHGFEMTAIDANGNRVGTFKKIGNTTQVIPVGDNRGLDSADKGKYIEHSFSGTKKKKWKLKWNAPSDATDPITFYLAGCEANGNGIPLDDYIYTSTAEINATP